VVQVTQNPNKQALINQHQKQQTNLPKKVKMVQNQNQQPVQHLVAHQPVHQPPYQKQVQLVHKTLLRPSLINPQIK
jgi:hypothetical protein